MANSLTGGKPRKHRSLLLVSAVILAVLFLCLSYFYARWYKRTGEEKARVFLSQVIESINSRTDFYKKHCSDRARKDIETHIDELTSNYDITVLDVEWSAYWYSVKFDEEREFLVEVVLFKGCFEIWVFEPASW